MILIDLILGVLLIFGLIKGFLNGLFVEVASLLALVLGVYGAINFSYYISDYINPKIPWNEQTMNIVAFSITFIIIVLAITIAGKALTKIADFAFLGMINKLLGGVFGLLKTALILSVLLLILTQNNSFPSLFNNQNNEKSVLYRPIKNLAPSIFSNVVRAQPKVETQEQSI